MDQVFHVERLDQRPLLVQKAFAEATADRLASGKADQ